MNKRITSLLLCFVMVFSMLATAVPVLAATPVELKVTADTTSAHPGDTINYKVSVGAVTNMGGLEFKLDIPSGLTIVDGSISIPTGLETTIDSDGAIVVPKSGNGYKWSYSAQSTGYTGTLDLVILTFSCTVDDGISGDKKVTINVDTFFDNDPPYPELAYTVTPATVNVTAAPVAVTGVTIDETLSVNIGQTKTPSFTVAPAEATNKTVSFTSNNPAVATVNATSGEVTGVKKGTATITVKTADGNFTDTCTVTVSCAHTNKSTVPAQDSTCTVKGWDEYKECDDCGQLFNTSDVEINEVPFRNLANHTGGTATCTTKAVCSVCHQPYGNYAAHSYTAETKKAEALKTAGNCRDKAVYYYSCSVCGNVEHNDAHTFLGDKNASVHVGGTSTVNASEPDHKNQIDGYTGDTKCLGCNEIIGTGTSIPAGAHTPSSTWNSDGTYHWKECTVEGCGVVIDGSKDEHSSTGANVATCQHKAVCDVCNVEYGALAAHNPASGWTSDASGHWHACRTAGCTEKCDFETHTPDRNEPTYDDAVKCAICGYVITPALSNPTVTLTVPFTKTVKQGGNVAPRTKTFTLEVFEIGNSNESEYPDVTVTATVATKGKGVYEGTFTISGPERQIAAFVSEGFFVRENNDKAANWTYSDAVWYVAYEQVNDTGNTTPGTIPSEPEYALVPYAATVDDSGAASYVPASTPSDKMTFENTYTKNKVISKPAESNQNTGALASPHTGDNSMMALWITLLLASGFGVVTTTVYTKKRKSAK